MASGSSSEPLLCLLGCLALGGCLPPSYTPAQPHHAAALGLTVDVERLDALSRGQVVVESRVVGEPGTRLVRVLLTPGKSEPCREGIRAQRLLIDGESKWLRPAPVAGSHSLSLGFAPGAAFDLLREPAALDFVLATGDGERCLRVPLTGREPALAWKAAVHGVVAASARVYGPVDSVGGVGSGWAISDAVGGYLGPLRLQAELGIGTANCTRRCLGSSGGFLWAPLGVSAHSLLFDQAGFALDLGLGYRSFFGVVSHESEQSRVRLDAPELSLRFAGTANTGPGLPSGGRLASAGFELFASDWRYRGALGNESSFVLGLGFSWDHGF
jgi:hypothetical protein